MAIQELLPLLTEAIKTAEAADVLSPEEWEELDKRLQAVVLEASEVNLRTSVKNKFSPLTGAAPAWSRDCWVGASNVGQNVGTIPEFPLRNNFKGQKKSSAPPDKIQQDRGRLMLAPRPMDGYRSDLNKHAGRGHV